MKANNIFLMLIIFTTVLSFAQEKNNIQKNNISIEKHLNDKIKGTVKLYQEYEYKKALNILKQCVKKSDSIKNDSLLGKSYIVKGIVYSYLGKETEAIKTHRKAEVIFTKMKNYEMLGIIYNNIAFAYNNNSKNLDSTITYYKKALDLYENINNTNRLTLTSANLGEAYQKSNQLEKAVIYTKKAIDLAKKKKRRHVLSFAHYNYSVILEKKNNLKEALKHLDLSQEIAEKDDYEQILVLLYKLKSDILEKLGDIKNSHINLRKYDVFLKRTHEIEKSRLIQESSVKYEVKENKALLEKTKLENKAKKDKLNKSRQIIFFTAILFFTSIIASLLLHKNNRLKLDNNKLLSLKNDKLEKLQHQTELNFLKTQIQPHFFFNTLSILQMLIIEKSEKAKEVVIKLSELMQYSIYEAKKENVLIWNEIKNIQNYLEITNLNQKSPPIVQIQGNIDAIKVPPLLYFSFIENCFKIDEIVEMLICFNNLGDKYLLFTMKYKMKNYKSKNEAMNKIGIKNINRRLNLIYKNNYSLVTEKTDNIFSVDLKIPV